MSPKNLHGSKGANPCRLFVFQPIFNCFCVSADRFFLRLLTALFVFHPWKSPAHETVFRLRCVLCTWMEPSLRRHPCALSVILKWCPSVSEGRTHELFCYFHAVLPFRICFQMPLSPTFEKRSSYEVNLSFKVWLLFLFSFRSVCAFLRRVSSRESDFDVADRELSLTDFIGPFFSSLLRKPLRMKDFSAFSCAHSGDFEWVLSVSEGREA